MDSVDTLVNIPLSCVRCRKSWIYVIVFPNKFPPVYEYSARINSFDYPPYSIWEHLMYNHRLTTKEHEEVRLKIMFGDN